MPRGCSVEHIPPNAFFEQNKHIISKPLISEITVPSCFPCNQKASQSDEYFVRYIVLTSALYSPIAKKVFDKNKSKWFKNKKIGREFLHAPHGFLDIRTPTGIIIDRQYVIKLPKEHVANFYKCLDKIAKAIYYKHEGKVPQSPLRRAWINALFREVNLSVQTNPLSLALLVLLQSVFVSDDIERNEGGCRFRPVTVPLFTEQFVQICAFESQIPRGRIMGSRVFKFL